MKPIQMRAVQPMDYQGKHYETGDVFQIAEERIKQTAEHFEQQGLAILIDETLAGEIKQEITTQKNFDLKDFKYFLNLKKDRRYLIEDFIYPKTTIMFYSPPGQFKSLLALQAAVCIANGKPFLGLKTKRKAVLYCDKENNEQILKERLIGLYKGMGLKRKNFPLKLLVRNGDLKDLVFVEELKEAIKENDIKLVIFDTLHRFADYEENKADDINRLYTTVFQPIMDGCDCSVMFLHHTNKAGGYRGSGDFLGMVDTSYSVIRKKGSDRFDLINEKSRSGEIETICGEIDFEENQIRIVRKDKPISAEDKAEQDQKFRDAIPIIKGMFAINQQQQKRKTIIDEFKAKHTNIFSESTIKRVLNWLVDKSELGRTKGGVYTRLW